MDATIVEGLTSLRIRYIHFFSSLMFFMFVVTFPVNKSEAHSTLFSRVQRFTKVIASIAMASGILLILVNRRIGIDIDNKSRRRKITIAVALMIYALHGL